MGKSLRLVHGLHSAFVFKPGVLSHPFPERDVSPQGDFLFRFPQSVASSFHNYGISP